MFEIKQNKAGEYLFSLYARNGQEILYSEPYTTKASCEKAIESVKRNSLREETFENKVSKNGKYYFWLKEKNGQIIGKSNYYESEASRDNGVSLVMKNANDAKINYEKILY